MSLRISAHCVLIALALALLVASGCQTTSARTEPPASHAPLVPSNAAPTTSAAAQVLPGSVIVDRGEAAYTVFTRVPEGASKADLEGVKTWLAKQTDAEVIGWAIFQVRANDSIGTRIRKNDYPECDVSRGVTELLRRYPGSPFGVTWNGGIAFTFNDYRHAKKLYASWQADPSSKTRPTDPRDDPIHPDEHLGPLLGR